MKRKIITALICLLAICSLAISCAPEKNENFGNIEDVELMVGDISAESNTKFEKQSNPIEEYSYKPIDFEPAMMRIEAPSSWKLTPYNLSTIRLDAPYADPVLPGATVYIKCLYDYDATPDDLDPVSHMASEYAKPMSSYITGLPFASMGSEVWIKSYKIADDISRPSFVKDDADAVTKITKNVHIIDKRTAKTHAFTGTDHIATYFRWETFPVMIETVVPSEKGYDAKDLLEYMLSTATHIPQKAANLEIKQVGKLSLSLPSDFAPVTNVGNVFISKSPLASTAGISIGIFSVSESKEFLTESYFKESYATKLPNLLLDPACANNYYALASVNEHIGEKLFDEELAYKGTVTMICDEEDYKAAPLTYGSSASWKMSCYIVERSNNLYLIADMYPPQDEALAKIIEKNAIATFSKN